MESMIWRPMILLVLLLAIVLTPETSNAQIVTSTFDGGADGWTATEPDEVAWAPAGGNPDGYLRFEELSGFNTYIIAPPAFLGDWSTLEGSGSLEYDHKIFSTGGDVLEFLPYRIVISGPGGSAEWLGPTPDDVTDWVTLSAPINEAAWNVQSGTWSGLLADVADLRIRIEQIGNWNNHDIDGIDNVSLINRVGPTLLMREPWVEDDDVHTGSLGVDSLRLLWSERVLFESADITVTNEDAEIVPFSVSGNDSPLMTIVFADEPLLCDRYTITISDTVVSAETGAAIDGDNDGLAGGDAVLTMEHRNRFDHDNDNDIDLSDLAALLSIYGTTYE